MRKKESINIIKGRKLYKHNGVNIYSAVDSHFGDHGIIVYNNFSNLPAVYGFNAETCVICDPADNVGISQTAKNNLKTTPKYSTNCDVEGLLRSASQGVARFVSFYKNEKAIKKS